MTKSNNNNNNNNYEGVDWIHLAEISDQWRALVNTVVSLRVL
jgi:hypothetical protein